MDIQSHPKLWGKTILGVEAPTLARDGCHLRYSFLLTTHPMLVLPQPLCRLVVQQSRNQHIPTKLVKETGRTCNASLGSNLRIASNYPRRRNLRISALDKSCVQEKGEAGKEYKDPERSGNDGAPEDSSAKHLESRLLGRLHTLLAHRHLVQPGQKILVAVSGGQDSVCLTYLLSTLQSSWGWKLGIVHCDHQWSPSSRSQGSHVSQIASSLGIDYYQAVATRNVMGEGSARAWRYGILQRIAISHDYSVIVTAHTASDRVETLLLNLFRGSGLHGLQSLIWKRSLSPILCLSFQNGFNGEEMIESVEDPSEGLRVIREFQVALVRPFLDTSRTEVRSLCKSLELPLWPDASNYCLNIRRNRIRHQLLPYLRKHLQTGIDKSLLRWAEILHGEQQFLESLCEDIIMKVELPYHGEGQGKRLDIILLQSLPTAIQRRIIKRFVESFTGKSLGFDHVERLRLKCLAPGDYNQLRMSLPGGVDILLLDKEMLLLPK